MTRLKCNFARLVMKGLAGLLTLPMAACFGATLVVTNMADSGPGSLRQAILDNESLGGGSTIIFSNTPSGSITLVSGELGVTNDLTILGPGSSVLTVSGNNASRVFRIQAGTVSISDLTIACGQVTAGAGVPGGPGLTARGGGIFVRQTASLAMTRCVVVSNTIPWERGHPWRSAFLRLFVPFCGHLAWL
jgi:hypothetical protein